MSYRSRNILFFSLFIVFIVLTLVLSLYASGRRVAFSGILRGELPVQKTGILVLDSNPKSANIYLEKQFRGIFFDGDVLRSKKLKTPQKIKNLLPGEYILTVEAEGYWPFEQKINIYPGYSTYIEDIILFRKNLPISFFSSPVQDINLDSFGQKILLRDENRVIDLREETEDFIGENINSLDFIGARKFLINDSVVFDYGRNNYFSLLEPNDNLSTIKSRGDNVFYINNNDSLNYYNTQSRSSFNVFSFLDASLEMCTEEECCSRKEIVDYEIYGNYYFLIEKEVDTTTGQNNYSFKIYSYRNKDLIREFSLPGSDSYEILSPPGSSNFVYIYDKNFKTIYIINTSSRLSSFWAVINNVSNLSFINSHSLVYFSDFEIYIFDSFLNESFLINRLDRKIKSAVWHPKEYIIYSTDQDIVILDLKYENYSINLIRMEEISNLVLDRMGSILYFSGKIGNQEGLYKLFIK